MYLRAPVFRLVSFTRAILYSDYILVVIPCEGHVRLKSCYDSRGQFFRRRYKGPNMLKLMPH